MTKREGEREEELATGRETFWARKISQPPSSSLFPFFSPLAACLRTYVPTHAHKSTFFSLLPHFWGPIVPPPPSFPFPFL